ncbi:MAG: TIM44-like domain-containing protein [Ginsengibacter sp.]
MNLWNSLKISIAGAKLSHLVQKEQIWDHGSMIEQAKTIFYKVASTRSNGHIEDLKKYLTSSCYERLKNELEELESNEKKRVIINPVIREIAVIEVHAGKNNKPDCFTVFIKAVGIGFIPGKPQDLINYSDHIHEFTEEWLLCRQGDWWVLDEMKSMGG